MFLIPMNFGLRLGMIYRYTNVFGVILNRSKTLSTMYLCVPSYMFLKWSYIASSTNLRLRGVSWSFVVKSGKVW